jgi:hypothetical protein
MAGNFWFRRRLRLTKFIQIDEPFPTYLSCGQFTLPAPSLQFWQRDWRVPEDGFIQFHQGDVFHRSILSTAVHYRAKVVANRIDSDRE